MAEDTNGKPTFPRFWLFVLLILGSLILGDLNQRMADARRSEKDVEILQARYDQIIEDIAEVREEIEIVSSDDFIHDWAHERAKMVKGGEVLVIFNSLGVREVSKVPVMASDLGSSDVVEVWLELILGQ
jgi:cell division protein FtsB